MKKRILSFFIILILIWESFQVFPTQNVVQATTTSQEYTFRDWGFISKRVSDLTIRSYVEPISSWDGVTVKGYVTFDTATPSSYIALCSTANGWYAVAVRYDAAKSQVLLGGSGVSMTPNTIYAST